MASISTTLNNLRELGRKPCSPILIAEGYEGLITYALKAARWAKAAIARSVRLSVNKFASYYATVGEAALRARSLAEMKSVEMAETALLNYALLCPLSRRALVINLDSVSRGRAALGYLV